MTYTRAYFTPCRMCSPAIKRICKIFARGYVTRHALLLQGSLPTFLDVGSSFSAAALTEDNLLEQMKKKGKRMVRSSLHSNHSHREDRPDDLTPHIV